MAVRGQFIVVQAFTLYRKGAQILLDEATDIILGQYHPGHTYSLTEVNAKAIKLAQDRKKAIITASTEPGLTLG